jgi:hypothetical protein
MVIPAATAAEVPRNERLETVLLELFSIIIKSFNWIGIYHLFKNSKKTAKYSDIKKTVK